MIKLVAFDMDGVLVELKNAHYCSLNEALANHDPHLTISLEEHYKIYDGLPTREKLKLLTRYKKLNESDYSSILKSKQSFTLSHIYDNISPVQQVRDLLKALKERGYIICVTSNSIANTIYAVLVKMQLLQYIDKVFSNEDVKYTKPNPEIYFKAISHFGLTPKECVIIEDSPYGLEAAYESGAHVIKISDTKEVNIDNVIPMLSSFNSKKKPIKWQGKNINVLIPMAGQGSRFQQAGYSLPKPLISVNGVSMIEKVVQNLNIDANFIFVVRRDHEQYSVIETLREIIPDCKIVYTDSVTEGAACTTLLAKELINNDDHLIIANSDQYLEWDSDRFYYQMIDQNVDGGIVTFKATHPKWSFAKVDSNGFVSEVAEKNPISDIATAGIYFWSNGSDYIRYAEQMIHKNIRVNNEFYVCPVFNEAISEHKKIVTYNIEKMWGLGTPEDLKLYIDQNFI